MPAEATPLAIGAAHARRTFELLDSDGSGSLSLEELEQAVAALGVAPPCRKKLQAFFDHLDHDSNGRICFKEFEAFHAARLQELQRVYADMSSTAGTLTSNDLQAAIEKAGLQASRKQLQSIMHRLDASKDGVVTFEEFSHALLLLPSVNPEAIFEAYSEQYPLDFAQGDLTAPLDAKHGRTAEQSAWRSMALQLGQQLYHGGAAGITSRTLTAPIDRVKVMYQAVAPGSQRISLPQAVKAIYREGGALGFFRGNLTNCIKIAPETACKFYAFDQLKALLASDPANVTPVERFVAGALAGTITQVLVYPLEIVKTRMAVSAPGTYSGILGCLATTVRTEGTLAMYKGLGSSIAGVIPFAGLDLMTNSILKDHASAYYKARGEEPTVVSVMACGIVSSSVGIVATYPLSLIRTRLQASGMPGKPVFTGIADCFRKTVAADGVVGLFKGLLPNMLKSIPAATISYTVYDVMKRS